MNRKCMGHLQFKIKLYTEIRGKQFIILDFENVHRLPFAFQCICHISASRYCARDV